MSNHQLHARYLPCTSRNPWIVLWLVAVLVVDSSIAAQPPRAVLGLPTGIEVVVSPGSMVPEVGVVVIAVGQGTVDLALVTPEGDHARVEQRTLHAQYQGPEGSE